MERFSIPTPTISEVGVGPLTIHFYALCIIAGIAVAIWLGNKRFTNAHSDLSGVVGDVAIFAIPAGVIGGRIYHVATTPENYFRAGAHPFDVVKIWNGGLGIWGAIALGTLTAYLAYRRMGRTRSLPPFSDFADALAPGILLAQAIGRWGNWFNGELFGQPLNAPWALEIPQSLRPLGYENFSTFHPTFAYESLWCLLIASLLLWLRQRLPSGSIFTLYIALYCLGRFVIEGLRIDATHSFAGLRLNQYVSLLIAISTAAAFTRIIRERR